MSIERLFISAVLDHGVIEPAIEAKISDEWFKDPDHTAVWLWVIDHWTRHSKVPDTRTLKQNFPSYRLSSTPEPLDYYIEQMRDRRKHDLMQVALAEVSSHLEEEDADAAIATMSMALQEVNSQVSSLQNEILTQTGDQRLEFYEELTRNPGRLRGMTTGFRAIDRATRGIQPEQYIVIAGAQKAGKSTVLMWVAITLNIEANAKVLLISFEMSREEQRARHDALRAGVSHIRLLDGAMTAKDKRRLERMVEDMEDCEDLILSTDIAAVTTVSGVRAQLEAEKPDVVLIDGVYLMEDERGERTGTPQALTNISRDLKRMAQSTKIPVLVSTQALEHKMTRRGGITASSVGYTSAFGQDCDVMLGIERVPDRENISTLKVLLSRSGPLAHTELEINWNNGTIDEYEPFEEVDDGDDEEERPQPKGDY